ncbi:MAG TPA: hypothetical protein VNQ50_03855 [Xanthobacteraceae bacterium]|jgi:hypothetical protein|nr:hypothetical protein [Xanthobacteraceae bacterium]
MNVVKAKESAAKSVTFAAVLGLMACTGDVAQAADGPFALFAGNWSGNGTITVQNGSRERIRCRGQYVVGHPSSKLSLSLRCASDSYKVELQSDISYDRGIISGSWNEASRQVFGQLGGRATANRIDAKVSSVGFDAALSLTARGNRQDVSIRSPGSEISEVAISMSRGGR